MRFTKLFDTLKCSRYCHIRDYYGPKLHRKTFLEIRLNAIRIVFAMTFYISRPDICTQTLFVIVSTRANPKWRSSISYYLAVVADSEFKVRGCGSSNLPKSHNRRSLTQKQRLKVYLSYQSAIVFSRRTKTVSCMSHNTVICHLPHDDFNTSNPQITYLLSWNFYFFFFHFDSFLIIIIIYFKCKNISLYPSILFTLYNIMDIYSLFFNSMK